MSVKKFTVKPIVKDGVIEGKALIINKPISYLGDLSPKTGTLLNKYLVKDIILFIPFAKGSTVGSYVLYGLRKYGNAPKAIVMHKVDPVTIIGCILGEIPLFEGIPLKFFTSVKNVRKVVIKTDLNEVKIYE